jgi:hypothetical protein
MVANLSMHGWTLGIQMVFSAMSMVINRIEKYGVGIGHGLPSFLKKKKKKKEKI